MDENWGNRKKLPYMSKYNEQKIYEKYGLFLKCSLNFEIRKK